MQPTFSIIIPAHNEENYIRKTLHSLMNQTYQNFETIVVTNGCTDKTEEIIKKRVSDKVKHLNLNVANVSRARNHGVSKASGKYLVFVDADTTLQRDALYQIKQQFSNKHIVATTLVRPDQKNFKYRLASNFKNFYHSTGIYKGCSGVLICRKDDFERANGYNPDLVVREHRKLILRLLKQGKFGLIKTTATNSTRRFEKWGLIKSSVYWSNQWFKDKFGDLKKSEYEKIR